MAANYQTAVTTGRVRLSYVNLFQPNDDGKYSVTILVPKSDTVTKARIDAAIEAAKAKGAAEKWNYTPPTCPHPIHDGDGVRPSDGRPFGDECKGHWVFTASSKIQPDIVDAARNPIISQVEIYSGVFGRVHVNFFPYGGGNTGFKIGIGAGLGPVQKLEDGEVLGGRMPSAEDVFTSDAAAPTGSVHPITGQPL